MHLSCSITQRVSLQYLYVYINQTDCFTASHRCCPPPRISCEDGSLIGEQLCFDSTSVHVMVILACIVIRADNDCVRAHCLYLQTFLIFTINVQAVEVTAEQCVSVSSTLDSTAVSTAVILHRELLYTVWRPKITHGDAHSIRRYFKNSDVLFCNSLMPFDVILNSQDDDNNFIR